MGAGGQSQRLVFQDVLGGHPCLGPELWSQEGGTLAGQYRVRINVTISSTFSRYMIHIHGRKKIQNAEERSP